MLKHDEMSSLVNGLSFMTKYSSSPSYAVDSPGSGKSKKLVDHTKDGFPKLLVSCGSGVSIIKVNDFSSYERVAGTMIGGGTLLGLSNLLTGVRDFDTIIKMAQEGDNANVDMLVKDIYGENSPFKDLQGDLLASSFAKVAADQTESKEGQQSGHLKEKYNKNDILNSLVTMISFNIGQLACGTAKLHNINEIYFVGSYIRDNILAQ